MKTNSASEIAKYIISTWKETGKAVTNLQLQHILYFLQVRHLKKYRTLLFPEQFSCFYAGPYISEVYYRYNVYAGSPILLDYQTDIPAPAQLFINSCLAELISVPFYKLNKAARAKGTPWALAHEAQTYDISYDLFQEALENNNLPEPTVKENLPMHTFLFKMNFEHPRTGVIINHLIGIVIAENFEAAKKKIWNLHGTDNATLSDDDITDITGKDEASLFIYMPARNNY